MLKIILLGIFFSIIIIYLKEINSNLVIPCIIISGISLLSLVIEDLLQLFDFFRTMEEKFGIDGGIIKLILKVLVISYLFEFGQALIRDMGINSLADKVVLCGKITIFCLSIPTINQILEILLKLL